MPLRSLIKAFLLRKLHGDYLTIENLTFWILKSLKPNFENLKISVFAKFLIDCTKILGLDQNQKLKHLTSQNMNNFFKYLQTKKSFMKVLQETLTKTLKQRIFWFLHKLSKKYYIKSISYNNWCKNPFVSKKTLISPSMQTTESEMYKNLSYMNKKFSLKNKLSI